MPHSFKCFICLAIKSNASPALLKSLSLEISPCFNDYHIFMCQKIPVSVSPTRKVIHLHNVCQKNYLTQAYGNTTCFFTLKEYYILFFIQVIPNRDTRTLTTISFTQIHILPCHHLLHRIAHNRVSFTKS